MKIRPALICVLCFASFSVSADADTAVSEFPVQSWLILGSFQAPGAADLLAVPYIPEAEAAPSEGESVGRRVWKKVESPDGSVNFIGMGFPFSTGCAAYAFTWVFSEKSAPARLLLGSDDGIAAWLNGSEVWRHSIQRGNTPKEDAASVRLEKGWNRLLLKVSQMEGGWGFSCTVASPAGLRFSTVSPAPGLRTDSRSSEEPVLINMEAAADPAGVKIIMKSVLYNPAENKLENLRCAIIDPEGGRIAESVIRAIESCGSSETEAALDPLTVARLWEKKGSLLSVGVGSQSLNFAIPDAVCAEALPLVIRSLYAADPEILRLAGKMGNALSAYTVASAALVPEMKKGMTACASGNPASVRAALKRITAKAVARVQDRSKERVHVVGHAHIDMNWLWTWNETLKTGHDTFRQVVAFMDEYPDFTFIQSQAALYKAMEKTEPELFERIRAAVSGGRWELGGGEWVEGDTDLSSGEAISRSFLLGQRFFLDRFGKTARVGWLPDNFGHVSQLPQILKLSDCDYFYFHRCRPFLGTFWWEGPDGSRVLAYSNKGYNGTVTPGLTGEIDDIVPEKRRLLEICGVGDHGGGPTRTDVETAHRLDGTPKFPSVKFTTAGDFFRESEAEMAGRPVHRGEMQFTFEGCYTNVSRIKEGNRKAESALFEAEWLASLRKMLGGTYPDAELRDAWETVLFNEFHDILPGSAIHESNEDAAAGHKWALAKTERLRDSALRSLADEVRFKAGAGQPVVVFNPQPRKRTALVEAEIFTHDAPAAASLSGWGDFYGADRITAVDRGQGSFPTVVLRDGEGKSVPAQIVWGKNFPPGWRSRVKFVADLPAGGYRSFYADASKPGESGASMSRGNGEFETDFFRIGFDMKTGEISRLSDKRTGVEYVSPAGSLNRLRIYMESPHDMNAWDIGPIARTEDVLKAEEVRMTSDGPVQACVEAVKTWGRSRFIQRTLVYRSYPRIDFELEAHWFEQGTPDIEAPMLRVVFPLSLQNCRFDCHVPFDVVSRPVTGREVPAQQWVDVTDGKNGIALLNRTKYGHSYGDGELRLTLLRSAYNPDLYPDQGLHRIRYALFPHAGDWKNGVWSEAESFNVPPVAAEPPSFALGRSHASRPEQACLIGVDPPEIVLSGLKQSEEGDRMIVRLVEVNGTGSTARLTLPVSVQSADRLDLLERPLPAAAAPVVADGTVSVALKPHEIVTLGIKFLKR